MFYRVVFNCITDAHCYFVWQKYSYKPIPVMTVTIKWHIEQSLSCVDY